MKDFVYWIASLFFEIQYRYYLVWSYQDEDGLCVARSETWTDRKIKSLSDLEILELAITDINKYDLVIITNYILMDRKIV